MTETVIETLQKVFNLIVAILLKFVKGLNDILNFPIYMVDAQSVIKDKNSQILFRSIRNLQI